MAQYRVRPSEHVLFDNAILVDTNVLVGAFYERDQHFPDAFAFLELLLQDGKTIVIPVSVAIEAWGMLYARTSDVVQGHKMLIWATQRADAIFVSDSTEEITLIQQIASGLHVDFVDSLLFHLARDVTKQCGFSPPISIATYDSADYAKCAIAYKSALRLLDPDTMDPFDIAAAT